MTAATGARPLTKAAWDARVRELQRMSKAALAAMYRRGVTGPDGQVIRYGWSEYPLGKWAKDDLISSILSIEFPAGALVPGGAR